MSTIDLNHTLEIIASSGLEDATILSENYEEILSSSTDFADNTRYIILRDTAVLRVRELGVCT